MSKTELQSLTSQRNMLKRRLMGCLQVINNPQLTEFERNELQIAKLSIQTVLSHWSTEHTQWKIKYIKSLIQQNGKKSKK